MQTGVETASCATGLGRATMTDLFDMHSLNHAAHPNLHCATHVQAFAVPNGYMNVERRTPMGADGLRHRAFEAWTRCPCSHR